jgi:16S rRNA (guanine527-N7)-methyltransferase
VSDRGASSRLQARAELAGVELSLETARRLADYLALLGRWNARINLTALDAAGLSDEAIDVLAIEPLMAARLLRPTDRVLIDVGSGSGSPAVPFKLAAPWLRVVMVESRTRKAAFLQEVVRQLDLPNVAVENCRIEDLAARAPREIADVVTVRAVRLDDGVWRALAGIIRPSGRVLLFRSNNQTSVNQEDQNFEIDGKGPLGQPDHELLVLTLRARGSLQ